MVLHIWGNSINNTTHRPTLMATQSYLTVNYVFDYAEENSNILFFMLFFLCLLVFRLNKDQPADMREGFHILLKSKDYVSLFEGNTHEIQLLPQHYDI